MPRINESLYQGSREVTFESISKYKKYYTNTKPIVFSEGLDLEEKTR